MRHLGAFAFCLLLFGSAQAANFDAGAYCVPNSMISTSIQQRFVHLDNDSSDFRNKNQSTAEALAYTYYAGPLTVGAAISYEYGTSKYDIYNQSGTTFNGKGKFRDQTVGVNLFGTYRTPSEIYGSGSLFLGYNNTKPKYLYSYNNDGSHNDFGGLSSENQTRFASSLEFGKVFEVGQAFKVTPHVGLDYAYIPGSSYDYTRNGQYNNLSTRSQNFFEIPIGVGVSKSFDYGSWVLTPSVDVAFINSVGPMDSTNVYPGFSTYNGTDWKTYGISGGHYGGRVKAGIDAKIHQRYDVGVDYTYEGRKDSNDHRLSAMFGVSF